MKKILSILLIIVLLHGQITPFAYAEDSSTLQEGVAPEVTHERPQEPERPQAPSRDDQTENRENRDSVQQSTNPEPSYVNPDENTNTEDNNQVNPVAQPSTNSGEQPTTQTSTNKAQDGQIGNSEVGTGDATATGVIATEANNNASISPTSTTLDEGGASVINSGNGSNSDNSGSISTDNTNDTTQDNSAVVNNGLKLDTTTGDNSSSENTGGNSSVTTGDANTSGTVITSLNTNLDGVAVSEFNINDLQGDYVLDFAANCILGCGGESAAVKNSGNGSGSSNDASIDSNITNNTFQTNNATVGNDLILSADSGNNNANDNTGGDSNITTGDANVAAQLASFANNNIVGNVILGVVNIFGDLIGDIIFPEDQIAALTASNTGNGSGSTNNSSIDTTNTSTTFQNNDVAINNNLSFDASTGDNQTNDNTGGNATVKTGDASVDANVLNIANSNINGGNMWLVLVNEAGNWVGKLLGAPEGTYFGGSEGTDFSVDQNGVITATNNGNGSDSTNNSNISQNNESHTTQNNIATINNNLDLSANTGKNNAKDNTGGSSNITTGDANIIANMVNFVNNNVVGNGKLVVAVVNVFGSWIGDFVSPGHEKQEKAATQHTNNNQANNNAIGGQNSNESNQTQPTNTSTTTTTPQNNSTSTTSTSQPVKTSTSGNGTVIATLGNSSNSNTASTNESDKHALVKGVQTNTLEKGKQRISINLAWALLAIPFVGMYFFRKKIILPHFKNS